VCKCPTMTRLLLGLLKGVLLGGGLGAAFQHGLGWVAVPSLLGYLLAIGITGTTGIVAGKAPWRKDAWIEAAVKGLVGAALGGLAYWGLSQLTWPLPYPGLAESVPAAGLPVVFGVALAGLYGAIVELDGARGRGEAKAKAEAPATLDVDLDAPAERVPKKKKKQRREQAATED
jgi:hypothetical protein